MTEQEATYNEYTYKVGELVYFMKKDPELTCCYFGRIKIIEPFENEIGEDDYKFTIEVLYTDYGYKFESPFKSTVTICSLKPAKEMLDRLIRVREEEIEALTGISKAENCIAEG